MSALENWKRNIRLEIVSFNRTAGTFRGKLTWSLPSKPNQAGFSPSLKGPKIKDTVTRVRGRIVSPDRVEFEEVNIIRRGTHSNGLCYFNLRRKHYRFKGLCADRVAGPLGEAVLR